MLGALVGVVLGGLTVALFGMLVISLVVSVSAALFRVLISILTSPFK